MRALSVWTALALIAGCGSEEPDDDGQAGSSAMAGAGRAGAGAGSGGSMPPAPTAGSPATCKPEPSTCPDLDIAGNQQKACCTAAYDCGYELQPLDEETKMLFPDAEPFLAMLTKDDPNGRCAPESVFFGTRPALWDHKVEVEGGEDILVTEQCESYTLLAFILPGCCLPDNRCGLSTDESAPTLADLAQDPNAPFTKPECVTADELNQQFRDSGVLSAFARTTASGTCDYEALKAELEMSIPQ